MGVLLARALAASAAAAGCDLTVTAGRWVGWASATFIGARHAVTLAGADGEAAQRWLGALEEAELAVRGHVVADVSVMAVVRADGRVSATVEALTVEEG